MSDLPKRLRNKASMIALGERIAWGSDTALMEEAADVIEALSASVENHQLHMLGMARDRDQLRALLTAQPQASADDSRKLSDLGNELHNLSCHVVHVNEGWAEQIGKIACELWKWPQASAAQSAPAGEREAFRAEYDAIGARHSSTNREIFLRMFRAGAAWQRTQSAGVPDEFEPDSVCEEADGCPTELAVLKRFWRENRARELSGPIREAIKWVDHLLFECGALTHTRAPSVHVYNKTFAAVEAAKAMLAAAPAQPAAQSELPAEVIAAAIRSVPAWSEISADLLAWEIFDYLYPGQKRKTVNGHYINCNAVSQYPAGKCNCGKGE